MSIGFRATGAGLGVGTFDEKDEFKDIESGKEAKQHGYACKGPICVG